MDFSSVQFRCSSLGHLMTEPKTKAEKEAGNLSESAKTHLIDVYVANKYGRQSEINSKYIEKGLMVEEDGITLYSRVKGQYFKKNADHLSNGYIKGTPDLFTGKNINKADRIIDIKCSWDIYTFFRVLTKDVSSIYYYQLQGYMLLTGAEAATLAYCLIDTPETLINDEKRRLLWKMGVVSEDNQTYQEACEELDKAMRFGDIPMKERVIEFDIPRDQDAIDNIYRKVVKGRQFLNEFEASRFTEVALAEYDAPLNATIVSNA
jgi:hypothetical protein